MARVYDIAPTAKFMNMWEVADSTYGHGRAFIGVSANQDDAEVVRVTKRRATHRIKWLFSSKYRNLVKAQRRSFVQQIENELSVSLNQGEACAFVRAGMKFANDSRQKAEPGMTDDIFDIVTQDLKAAHESAGNEKAYLRNLSIFFQKTRERVMMEDAETLGAAISENEGDFLGSEQNIPHIGQNQASQNVRGSLFEAFGRISHVPARRVFVTNNNESEHLFRLQLDPKQCPEIANNANTAARAVHNMRTIRERAVRLSARNENLKFEYDRVEPIAFTVPSGSERIYAVAIPRHDRPNFQQQSLRALPLSADLEDSDKPQLPATGWQLDRLFDSDSESSEIDAMDASGTQGSS